ncbi:MAG: NAD(P)/FAD-dependent oxidoreductase, partial [Gammaproteobacteria bacterium]|nr:NAD(P)/FAD-dependent oxidoreductase [Gammaproteobacteria bacterium]
GLHIPNIPDIPGSDQFAGAVFHSARWDHDFDPAGKRVAVIGSAASAVQIVPQLARQTRHLYVFQRTANWIIPRGDGDVAGWKKWILRRVPGALRAYRWLLYWMAESRFPAFRSGSLANRLGRLWPLWYLRREVPDRKLRRQLTPDYPLGCKRILRSDDYYRALVRDDVELVTAPVRQFDNSGIEAGNDHYAVDAIVFATGFRVFDVTSNVRIEGQSGQLLSERWAEGIGAHRTVMVPGFPNFFMLLGPNSALGHNSVIVMIEAQTRYVAGCLEALQAHRWQSLQPSTSAYQRDQEKIHKALDKTVWRAGCSSWYQDEHGKIFTLWPHTATRYRLSLRRPRLDEFDVD